MKTLKIGSEARQHACEALANIAAAVGSTLGPTSCPFLFEKRDASGELRASVSKDGLTVLRSLEFIDPVSNAVHYLCQQASAHTVRSGGDGTTSTIVFASAIANAILNANHISPQAFARQIRQEISAAIEAIRGEAITTDDIARSVALTSSNWDEELTAVVMDVIRDASAFGTIVVDKNPAESMRYLISRQDGYCGARGYLESKVTHILAGSVDPLADSDSEFVMTKPTIICFNGQIATPSQITAIAGAWERAMHAKKVGPKLILLAYDFHPDIEAHFTKVNRQMAGNGSETRVMCLRPVLSAEMNSQLQYLRDVAAFTGCQLLDAGALDAVTEDYFGTCNRVVIGTHRSVFHGRSKKHWIPERVNQNNLLISGSQTDFDKEIARVRNAELAGGLVRVTIGGGLMADIQERADRFDDASKAAQACLRSGALPGAGVSYIRAGTLAGVSEVVQGSLMAITRTLMENFGGQDVCGKIDNMRSLLPGVTFKMDPDSGAFVIGHCQELNVVDSVETVCAVLQNGAELGITVATLGGFSLTSNLDEFDKMKLVKSAMESI